MTRKAALEFLLKMKATKGRPSKELQAKIAEARKILGLSVKPLKAKHKIKVEKKSGVKLAQKAAKRTKIKYLKSNPKSIAHVCSSNETDIKGRCLGHCFECEEHLQASGRYTPYCPSCNVCSECGCPQVDNFEHYSHCSFLKEETEED